MIRTVAPELLANLVVQPGETVACFVSPETRELSAVVRVEGGGHLFVRSFSTGGSAIDLRVELTDTNARADVRGVAVADRGQKSAVRIETVSLANKTAASIRIAAFALDGGKIETRAAAAVAKGLSGVEAETVQSNVFLGQSGKIRGMPELRIASDDVKARHACSVDRVSAESLFYLRSRGLSEHAATSALLSAKVSEVFAGLPDDLQKTGDSLCFSALSAIVSNK